MEAGSPEPIQMAPGADIRSDISSSRIYRYGELTDEVDDISEFWSDDLVSFLLGCSFSFEAALPTRAALFKAALPSSLCQALLSAPEPKFPPAGKR